MSEPANLREFSQDTESDLTNAELSKKYGVTERTIYRWKRNLRGKKPRTVPEQEKVDVKEDGNYTEVYTESTRIKTLDQLIAAAEVDLDTWVEVSHEVNKWEVGAKDKRGHLKWANGGIAEGELTYNGVKVTELWQVKALFRRRKLIPILPTIQPIECPVTLRREPLEFGPVLSSFLWTDPQFGFRWENNHLEPFHDRAVLDLWLQIATWLQPTRLDILGDWFDATSWTDYWANDPAHDRTMQPSILESHWWLRQFREACPNSKITIHPGNHDERIMKAIKKHLPVAYQLRPADEMSLPPSLHPARLLALHQLDIDWLTNYPNDEDWLGESLRLNHGVWYLSGRGNTTKRTVEASDVNTVSGHGHRSEHVSKTVHLRDRIETLTAYSIGCSCRIDGPVPAKHKYNDWQQSSALVHYTEDHHNFTVIPVSTEGPKEAIVDGRLFTARDRLKDLYHDHPDIPW